MQRNLDDAHEEIELTDVADCFDVGVGIEEPGLQEMGDCWAIGLQLESDQSEAEGEMGFGMVFERGETFEAEFGDSLGVVGEFEWGLE